MTIFSAVNIRGCEPRAVYVEECRENLMFAP